MVADDDAYGPTDYKVGGDDVAIHDDSISISYNVRMLPVMRSTFRIILVF